jgi:hypothetical protein
MRYVVLYALGVLCVLLVLMARICRETFAEDRVLLVHNPLQHMNWSKKQGWKIASIPPSFASWEDTRRLFASPSALQQLTGGMPAFTTIDPVDLEQFYPQLQKRMDAPKGYFVALLRPEVAFKLDCPFALQGKVVGVLDRSAERFVKAIMNGYRIPSQQVQVNMVPMAEWDQLPSVLNSGMDVIFAYVIPNSPFHQLLMTQRLSLMGFRTLDASRVKIFHPYLSLEQVDLRELLRGTKGSSLMVMDREKNTWVPSMQLAVVDVPWSTTEGFMSQASLSTEYLDPSFRCFGDLTIESKALCDSPYDVIGMAKRKPTVWDQPCVKNEDCPFYQANKNYPNERGGCMTGGMCEFPVGIKRVAYRKYTTEGIHAPFCYQCDRPLDPTCCAKQAKWGRGPDYAFENDTDARRAAGLETSIRMI